MRRQPFLLTLGLILFERAKQRERKLNELKGEQRLKRRRDIGILLAKRKLLFHRDLYGRELNAGGILL